MLLSKLQDELKEAQLARNETKVSTLRLLLSEIHNAQIQKGQELSDEDIIGVVQREGKKRKEAAVAFRSGGREDQAQKEEAELLVLESYLPKQLSNEELTKIVEDTINELGVVSIQDMGKVIGQADGGEVSSLVKEKLS